MDLLEHFYQFPPLHTHTLKRTFTFSNKSSFNLYGIRGGGKSTAILSWLASQKEGTYLYIDLEDPKLLLHTLDTYPLNDFIFHNRIQTIVLDHYVEGLLDALPDAKQIILISRTRINDHNLEPIRFSPFSFTEHINLSPKHPQHHFSQFLKNGALPEMWLKHTDAHHTLKRYFQYRFGTDEQALLIAIAQHHTHNTTPHRLYLYAKEYFRISKDRVYATLKKFEDEGLILFITDRLRKSGSKLILFDHLLANYLATKQSFQTQFDTIVALRLHESSISYEAFGMYGYITQNALIVPAPFYNQEGSYLSIKRNIDRFKAFDIQKVYTITVNNRYTFTIDTLECEAIPFYDWEPAASLSHNASGYEINS